MNKIRVKCICEHLYVPEGTKGTVIKMTEGGCNSIVKWDNGYMEGIEWDFVEIL